jgi:hypothetical protein
MTSFELWDGMVLLFMTFVEWSNGQYCSSSFSWQSRITGSSVFQLFMTSVEWWYGERFLFFMTIVGWRVHPCSCCSCSKLFSIVRASTLRNNRLQTDNCTCYSGQLCHTWCVHDSCRFTTVLAIEDIVPYVVCVWPLWMHNCSCCLAHDECMTAADTVHCTCCSGYLYLTWYVHDSCKSTTVSVVQRSCTVPSIVCT